MTDLEKIFVQVFVDENGNIYDSVNFHRQKIKEAMTLYAECEVKKLSKADVSGQLGAASKQYQKGFKQALKDVKQFGIDKVLAAHNCH